MSVTTASVVLDVGLFATKTEVDKAFRQRARLCHPDRLIGATPAELAAANAQFTRVCDARDVLHARLRSAPHPAASSAAPSSAPRSSSSAPPRPTRAPGQDRRSTPSPPTSPPHRATPPPPKTMSFAEFVAARDAASWVQTSPTSPTSPATGRPRSARKLARARRASAHAAQPGSWQRAAPRYRPGRSPFGVLIGLLVVVSVGAYVAVLVSNLLAGTNLSTMTPAPPLDHAATDLLASASVVAVDDAATYQGNCQGDLGCWIWSVTARVDCPVATINAGFSDAADGANLRTATTQAAVVAEVPFLVVEHAATAAEQYAGIVSMTC